MNDHESQAPPPPEPAPRPGRGKINWWRRFWLATLVVSLGYAWHCFYVPSNSIAWAENYPSAQRRAVESGKPLILFFTGNWCVPCRIMKRNVWADEQVAASVHAGFIPLAIDGDDPNAAATWSRYGIEVTPTTIIVDPHGKVLFQRAGEIGRDDFLELLANLNRPSAPPEPQTPN
ncbi:MAG: thioredoxin family protein [Isosphaeraceae bacterium]|nr:thioredoxin family protein [Isosphaeraceae bacterium]